MGPARASAWAAGTPGQHGWLDGGASSVCRCIMTTYDPDTLVQDVNVLKRIGRELEGTMGLDTAVERGGAVRVGDAVELVLDHSRRE